MSAAAHPSTSSPRRVIVASLLGTSFGRPFFPNVEALTGTLLAFATYAVGFVARPLGGVVFGHFGDRVGRRTCCPAHAEQPDSRHRTPPGGHPADAYPPSGGVRGTGSRTPWTRRVVGEAALR